MLCSRRSTACVRQRERAQPGFERGSAQHPCQRRDWNVIYRMYRAYLSSCIFWSLAVPVASMAILNGMCERAVTTYVLGSVQWSNNDVKKLFTHTCTSAHGPRRFFARSAYTLARVLSRTGAQVHASGERSGVGSGEGELRGGRRSGGRVPVGVGGSHWGRRRQKRH